MSFAENLKVIRKYRGMTQKELSDASGVSCSSIINYENSRRQNPTISILTKLAKALGTSVDILGAQRLHIDKKGVVSVYRPMDVDAFIGSDEERDDWEEFIQERGEQDILQQLAVYIRMLNKEGAAEAVKRVAELTEVSRYRMNETDPLLAKHVFEGEFHYYKQWIDKRQRMEDEAWPEDAPQTAAEHSPGSEQTDAGK